MAKVNTFILCFYHLLANKSVKYVRSFWKKITKHLWCVYTWISRFYSGSDKAIRVNVGGHMKKGEDFLNEKSALKFISLNIKHQNWLFLKIWMNYVSAINFRQTLQHSSQYLWSSNSRNANNTQKVVTHDERDKISDKLLIYDHSCTLSHILPQIFAIFTLKQFPPFSANPI